MKRKKGFIHEKTRMAKDKETKEEHPQITQISQIKEIL